MTVPKRRYRIVSGSLVAVALAFLVAAAIAVGQSSELARQGERNRGQAGQIAGLRDEIADLSERLDNVLDANAGLLALAAENSAKIDALRFQLALLGVTPVAGPSRGTTTPSTTPPTTTTTSPACVHVLNRRLPVCP